MNDIHTIILADGFTIQAELNGNNYITDTPLDFDILSDENLKNITIDGESNPDLICTNIWQEDGKTRFVLRQPAEEDLMQKQINELLAMLRTATED